jgi:hypothetical protein
MRTALIAGLIAGSVVGWLNFAQALSNADFIYMCCGAALLDHGRLLVSPYFPPGYPLLLWAVVQAGVTALAAGALLSACGTALSAGAVAYMGRLWRLPAALALALGLLAASLPDLLQVAFNPHLDALYSGLAAVLIASALRTLIARPNAGVTISAVLSATLLCTLRWHAVVLLAPVLLVLLCVRQSRRLGWALLLCCLLALGWSYWALYATCGSLELATGTQVGIGEIMRQPGGAGFTEKLYQNYPAIAPQLPRFDWFMAADNAWANWPIFLTRKAVLLGVGAWLLVLLIRRRCAPQAWWLPVFIAGYTLTLSTTYFTPRASALPELCGIMLLAAALSVLLPWQGSGVGNATVARAARLRGRQTSGPSHRPTMSFDPALAGLLLFVLLLAGTGYNVWREIPQVRTWRARLALLKQADAQALVLAGGRHEWLYGQMDLCGWTQGRYSLPGASWSRFWLDDPAIAPLFAELIPRFDINEASQASAPLRAVCLWPEQGQAANAELAEMLTQNWNWREVLSNADGARLWQRGQ